MRALHEVSGMSVRKLAAEVAGQPKCYGIAKNFFTNAMKADANLATPAYPLMFHKPFSW